MTRLDKARISLSDWHFWVGVAYAGLTATVVALVVLFNRTAHEEAARTASAKAASATQVGQCFTAVKNAPVLRGFIDSHEAVIDNGLIANRAALEAEAPGDPLREVRLQSIARLTSAKENANELRSLIDTTTPTKKKCVAQARSLGVDPSRYINSIK